MKRPKTLPVFNTIQHDTAHKLLAIRVAYLMGRKFDEDDWAAVYCGAMGIPKRGWSNLNIDVSYGLLGVEHKMLCYRSKPDLREACGEWQMHPSATRSIRVPSTNTPAQDAMVSVLDQYAELIRQRANKVRQESKKTGLADMRVGWLLWQVSLRQFMYFEEEMLPPDHNDYRAEWVESGGGVRKKSRNLWIYEKDSGQKRYSITTEAGAKVQPYFHVPPPTDQNLHHFTVIGEAIKAGVVKIWVTDSTFDELQRLVGDLGMDNLSRIVLDAAREIEKPENAGDVAYQAGKSLTITSTAYEALVEAVDGVNDDHMIRLLARQLRRGK